MTWFNVHPNIAIFPGMIGYIGKPISHMARMGSSREFLALAYQNDEIGTNHDS